MTPSSRVWDMKALDLIRGHGLLLTTGASCAAGCAPSTRASRWGR